MKFFTIQWWSGEADDPAQALEDYRRHLERILPDLPEDLQRLVREVSLHDAHLRRLEMVPADRTLAIDLDGCHYDAPTRSYQDCRIQLTYRGVERLVSTSDPTTGLPGPHGYGDLGYDELDSVGPGVFEHRMLFSTGIELAIRFSACSLQVTRPSG